MNIQELSEFARDLGEYFGGTIPGNRVAAWHPKVDRIPVEAIAWIFGKLTDECDAMPRNLPKTMLALWYRWQQENPDRVAKERHGGCPDCDCGILFVERDGVTAAVFCRCNPGNPGVIGRASLRDLEASGWVKQQAGGDNPKAETKAKTHGHYAQARRDARDPHPERYDDYEDRHVEGW